MTRTLICIALLLLAPSLGMSQESPAISEVPAEQQVVTTSDGSRYIGRITESWPDSLRLETALGPLVIPRERIRAVAAVDPNALRGGEYRFANPNLSRLYVAPTGRMLKQGEGYFSVVYLVLPGFQYGLSDHVTLGGGMSILPGVAIDEQLLYVTPKVGAQVGENVSVAAGALLGMLGEGHHTAGILYAGSTFGTPDASITAGLGYGFADSDETTMMIAGGEKRLGRRTSLVSENWYFPEIDKGLVSFGLRFFGESLSADLCLINDPSDPIYPGLPYVDFVFNF